MDQILNTQMPRDFKRFLTAPATVGQTDRPALEMLVQTYPQCSVFHLLLARASQNNDPEVAAQALQSAAVNAPNREVLFKIIHQPEQISAPKPTAFYRRKIEKQEISDTSFIDQKPEREKEKVILLPESFSAETENAVEKDSDTLSDKPPVSADAILPEELIAAFTDEKPEQTVDSSAENETINEEAILIENDQQVEEISKHFINEPADEVIFPMEETTAPQQEQVPANEPVEPLKQQGSEIDEEVYDEIIAIEDIRLEPVQAAESAAIKTIDTEESIEEKDAVKEAPVSVLDTQDKAEKDMLSSIASIDYFTFNNKFGQNQPAEQPPADSATENKTTGQTVQLLEPAKPELEKEADPVAKYHDEKMPYTFTWWLDKTRKEYAGTYQPYVKNAPPQKTESGLSVGPELHQQYIESIFQQKPPHNLTEEKLTETDLPAVQTKEDELIARFIIQEPHIHPPSSEKLDTENKAKKSSEDADILVTETLAKIYLDQMLYHKALDTYKKLLLKFPEKSLYFADQIESIEKKIN